MSGVFTLETGIVSIDTVTDNTFTKEVTFNEKYNTPPTVSLTIITDLDQYASVNTYIKSITKYKMNIAVSGEFVGTVHYKIIKIE